MTTHRPQLRALLRRSGLALTIIALATVLAVAGGSVRPRMADGTSGPAVNRFLQLDNLVGVAKDASFVAILAIGVTLVIILGGIDLSVGSTYALAGIAAASALRALSPTAPAALTIPVGIATAVATGAVCGAVNGGLVTALRVHPFIVTLGTMEIFRGVAFVVTRGETISPVPESFVQGGIKLSVGGVNPIPLVVMLAVAVLAARLQRSTLLGRYLYAVGGNERAATYAALPVGRVKFTAYVLCGACAGLSGALMVGYYNAAGSDAGAGYELNAIAAAVIGGTALSGGAGTAGGAVLGAIVIAMIENGIAILRIDQNWSRIVVGAAIVVATLLDRLRARLGSV